MERATSGRFQLTSDGLNSYRLNVPFVFGSRVDFAQLIKNFASSQSTVRYSPASDWGETVTAEQLQHETARVAGILLIIGLLHGVNLLALPVMGRLLTLNRQLDESTSS